MKKSKEELRALIEEAREVMNGRIDEKTDYDIIYQYSVMLDELIAQYMVAEN